MNTIYWPVPIPANPDYKNHNHLPLTPTEPHTTGPVTGDGTTWAADSAWDDFFLRFTDADKDDNNDLIDRFGHGYMDPSVPAQYKFSNDFAAKAKPLIAEAFKAWDTAAKTISNGKTTKTGDPLKTSISFKEGSAQDLLFEFEDGFLERRAFAEWIVGGKQQADTGYGFKTMVFESSPTDVIWVKETGWQISGDGGATWGDTFNLDVGWSYDKSPAKVATRDLDYKRLSDGMVFDELASLTLETNGFHVFTGVNTLDFYEMDFFTIALHELGHVIGLLHTPDDSNRIMRSEIAYNFTFGEKMQTIDDASATGAAVLYTIPVPEPDSLLLLMLGIPLLVFSINRLANPLSIL